jgi:uncharacterized SAM-binding protein YcdF (DUF218 family)
VSAKGRLIFAAVAVILFAFLAGFVVFASAIARYRPSDSVRADGIVVLTGGEHRLSEAARLLAEGRGKRLLISGVYHSTTRKDLFRNSRLSSALFGCCVDVGYAAHDTSGNADETRAWASSRRFASLIIVTSIYHMPRSLTELGRVMPDVTLVPYAVVSRNIRTERWWMHAGTVRLLLSEYVKFLPSAARFVVARLLHQKDSSALAQGRRAGAAGI